MTKLNGNKKAGSWYEWLFGGQTNQHGGGKCTLCGSPNTTRATCPLNPNPKAKNPSAAKHPMASGKPVAAAEKIVPRQPVGSRGCIEQMTAKYQNRPSPPFPANECCGEVMQGNNGKMWESRMTKAGNCRWFELKE